MYNKFIKALAWNSGAVFAYKIALLMHQIFLYSIISQTLYGLQSTLFATMYICIALTNFGFDETLLPFFSTFSKNKHNFLQLLHYFITHTTIISSIAIALWITITYGSIEFLHNIQRYCNKNVILLLAVLFFIESTKKSIIAMMQLAFLNKQIACAQMSMLTAYILCVWGLFAWHGQLTLEDIFIPMLITSTAELSYLLYYFLKFYDGLPKETGVPIIPFKVLFKQRISNYINQIVKIIYSPNSMTIFFAYSLGFQQAATIKFFTNIITLCYTCIAKSIGVTTGAVFAFMNQMSELEIQKIFKDLTSRYFQLLSMISLVMLCIVSYAYYSCMITQVMAWQILLFFTMSFLENISITYEQLLMSRGKAWMLACMNGVGLILLLVYGYAYSLNTISNFSLVIIVILIKITNFLVLYFSIQSNKRGGRLSTP